VQGGPAPIEAPPIEVALGDLSPERPRRALIEALEQGARPHAVVRRYRAEPSPLVRNMNGSWQTGRLDAVLAGDFDLIAASQVE
jgi:ATP-dependent Clp protease ATP-binding subunit ClpC